MTRFLFPALPVHLLRQVFKKLILHVFYRCFRIMRVSVAILSSRWLHGPQNGATMESRWRQDGVKMAHVGAKMVLRWATWRALGSNLVTFVEYWARSLQKMTDCETLVKHNANGGFLQCYERSWRLSWLILALGWTMLGNLVAILEQLCDKMYPKLQKNAHCENPRKTQ